MDQRDRKLLRLRTKRVGVALRAQRDNEAVRTVPLPGQVSLWEVGEVA